MLATFAIVHFGNKVTSLKQQQLRAYQSDADARIATANAQAAEANVKVAAANLTAAEANAKAAQAQAAASAANASAEQSRLGTAKIEGDNLKLQEQLNSEHDARLAIEKRMAQRGITLGEMGPIRRATYPLGVQPIDIVYYKDDPESRTLAGNLANVFQAWKITLYEAPGGYSHQVDVSYDPKDDKAKERATAIFDALTATGKLRMGGPWKSLPSAIEGTSPGYYSIPPTATIRINVGYR